MRILITGGTGFIGQHLSKALVERGDRVIVLSRSAVSHQGVGMEFVQTLDEIDGPVDAVINLAGAGIADKRWNALRKAELRLSRIDLTERLVQWICAQEHSPQTLISGSAIGYYGGRLDDEMLDESATPIYDFTHQLCADWETAAMKAEDGGCRVCCVRTGVVLGSGGALKKMLPPFRLGLGGPIASGRQWFSWIHLQDEVRAILFLLDQSACRGAYNLTAPTPITNADFTRALAQQLKRPACFRVPEFVLKLMLGEGAEMLTLGQRVIPARLLEAGFTFEYAAIEPALADTLS